MFLTTPSPLPAKVVEEMLIIRSMAERCRMFRGHCQCITSVQSSIVRKPCCSERIGAEKRENEHEVLT
jgi:hypothetical protein